MQINHDPFSYLDMPRKTRFSNESNGSSTTTLPQFWRMAPESSFNAATSSGNSRLEQLGIVGHQPQIDTFIETTPEEASPASFR